MSVSTLNVALFCEGRRGGRVLAALRGLKDQVNVEWVISAKRLPGSTDHQSENQRHNPKLAKPCQWNDICKDSRVDAIVVSSTKASVNMVRRALNAGKAVLIESSPFLQPTAIAACYHQAETSRSTIMFGSPNRYDSVLRAFKGKIRPGTIGNPKYLNLVSTHKGKGDFYRDCVSSDVDKVNWMLGDLPRMVYSNIRFSNNKPLSTGYTYATTVLKYDDIIASIETFRTASDKVSEMENITVGGMMDTIKFKCSESPKYEPGPTSPLGEKDLPFTHICSSSTAAALHTGKEGRTDNSLGVMLQEFISTVTEGLPFVNGEPEATLETVNVTNAAKKSNEIGKEVAIVSEDINEPLMRQKLWKESTSRSYF